jgi:bla regulator protein BlaR1
MDKFFYESLKTGIFVSVFILLTLLLSKVISRAFNANWRFQVWKVYTACLILPISYIMSKIRFPDLEQKISTIAQPAVLENATPVHNAFELINVQGFTIAIGKQFNSLSSCLFIVWLLGAFVYSAYLLGTYFHLKKLIKRGEPLHKITAYDLQADFLKSNRIEKMIPIRRCKFISVPIIAGIRKPTILLPAKEYEKEKLKIIIGHELTHHLRHDLWCKGAALLALVLHWYNPIVHMMNRALNADIEVCCDQDVIKNKDKEFCNLYSDVIMDSILDSHQFKGTLFACMGSKKKEAEPRFLNIHTDKKRMEARLSQLFY